MKDAACFIAWNSFAPLDLRKAVFYLEPDQFPIVVKPGFLGVKQFERMSDHFFRVFEVAQFDFALNPLFAGFINRDIHTKSLRQVCDLQNRTKIQSYFFLAFTLNQIGEPSNPKASRI